MTEIPLRGGRVTEGVVRVGDTVRRPQQANSLFVRALLAQLEQSEFDGAPRYLGTDEQGREIFSYLAGEVPPDLDARICDKTLQAAAHLVKRFHDATAGTPIVEGQEVVCHNDLSPCNFVFRDGEPVGIIDFGAAAPGTRLQDLAMALFLWLNLGTDGQRVAEQTRRIALLCRAYGIAATHDVINAIITVVEANVERLREASRLPDVRWWQEQLNWLRHHRDELSRLLY